MQNGDQKVFDPRAHLNKLLLIFLHEMINLKRSKKLDCLD